MPKALLKDDFSNLLEYQQWLGQSWGNLSALNHHFQEHYTEWAVSSRIRGDRDWYGAGVTYRELADGITQYKDPELIERLYNKVAHELPADIVNRIKKRKLNFNALGLGVFSFDRAAMTLYRAKMPSGKMAVKTATKELFAWFPAETRDRHAVELFISCDAPGNMTADRMLYGGISAILIAELLINAGVKVRINIVIGSGIEAREKYVGCVVPVKGYDDPFDRNLAALLTSDPRFMRFDAFKGVIAAFDHFRMPTPAGMGLPMNAAQLKDMFEQSGYTKKSQAQHRYYFGGTFSEAAAIKDIERIIDDIARKLDT
ncbi:hypothetical protein HGH93_12085 [Chitinophaga polysaccharea]|uniref:hypothetical protein n=1 Tax=Chitinophaga polysaccharea TaxID=1293035 RepID=UPI00145535C5|nr:hypothetical protein [Chitinophaga polysaccharea]NLR58846.1 hypothetical protein [Chitinophaga polysaccharea]